MSEQPNPPEATSESVVPESELPNRQTPFSAAFRSFINVDWAPYDTSPRDLLPAAGAAAARRERVSALYPDTRLVIPAGGLKTRSNDTDYPYRAHSAFAHLTGLGGDREPDAVLVLEPVDGGHEATLYFKPRAPRTAEEFYADPRYGEMWVGQRESLDEMSQLTGLSCAPVDDLEDALAKNAGSTTMIVLREADEMINKLVDKIRNERRQSQQNNDQVSAQSTDQDSTQTLDDEFAVALSELRLIKDEFELDQLREACARTAEGFEAVVADLPEALRRGRGERWVEGIFGLHARHVGNAVGYDTIAASGDHANTLHWIRNDGDLREGDLLLLDAGVELDTLYTADITRTLPVDGHFTDAQRRVYQAVLDAADAALAVCLPGTAFKDVHKAAITVLAARLEEWGLLPVSAAESLGEDGGQHRRWMVHGTSHHLGIDVHDCSRARQENYRDGVLAEGMVITVEPGLYFKSTDELVPAELRGIGVRIEDDIAITADGYELLSKDLPRSPDDVEAWMAPLLDRHAVHTPDARDDGRG